MDIPAEGNDPRLLADCEQLDLTVQPQRQLMQELDRKDFDLYGRPVGHLLIQGMNLGSVRSQDLFLIAQDDNLEPRVPQFALGAVDLLAIVRLQGRTVVRKILKHRSEKVHRRRGNSIISEVEQRFRPCQIRFSELLINDCIGPDLGRQIADNSIQYRENLCACRGLRERESTMPCPDRQPTDEKLQTPQPRRYQWCMPNEACKARIGKVREVHRHGRCAGTSNGNPSLVIKDDVPKPLYLFNADLNGRDEARVREYGGI